MMVFEKIGLLNTTSYEFPTDLAALAPAYFDSRARGCLPAARRGRPPALLTVGLERTAGREEGVPGAGLRGDPLGANRADPRGATDI